VGGMARVRSPDRDKAFEIYKENYGDIANREIARVLKVSEKTISGWKVKDKWNEKLNGVLQKEIRSTPKEKRNKGGQPKNKNAEKFGFFSKYLPEDTIELIERITEKNPLDILWEQISIQYAAIIRAQKIMYVESKEEMIKELKKEEYTSDGDSKLEYEFQFSWDRQATFLNSQSRAMGELRSLIKQYNECLKANEDTASDEEKSRLGKLNSVLMQLEGGPSD
jgi:uncharacterized protein YjcR